MKEQAIYDLEEPYSYLQNRDKINLNLTKKQRADLLKSLECYHRIVEAETTHIPIKVTCQAPAQQ